MFPLFFLYCIIVFVLAIGAFFIVYHILRYSLTLSLGYFGTVLFVTIFLFLLSINYVSFRSLDSTTALPALEVSPLLEMPAQSLTPTTTRNPW